MVWLLAELVIVCEGHVRVWPWAGLPVAGFYRYLGWIGLEWVWARQARDWSDDGIIWQWAWLDLDLASNVLGSPYAVMDTGWPSFDLSMGSAGHGLGCTSALPALGSAYHWLVWPWTGLAMGRAGMPWSDLIMACPVLGMAWPWPRMDVVWCWNRLCWP
jgi:hypothetical protein